MKMIVIIFQRNYITADENNKEFNKKLKKFLVSNKAIL